MKKLFMLTFGFIRLKLLFVFYILSFTDFSQTDFSAIVVDIEGNPLPSIQFNILEENKTIISDDNGMIDFMAASKFSVQLSCISEFYEKKTFVVQRGIFQKILLTETITNLSSVLIRVYPIVFPGSFTVLNLEKIAKNNFAQDMPFILGKTSNAVTTSDGGIGVGYTGLRIRGVDPTRTNVTINGISINDGESQGVYWVNVPDLASSSEMIQIQRGVGMSTNGAAAFGASINILTNSPKQSPSLLIDNSIGSFGTIKNTVYASTGIEHGLNASIRLSNIQSNGYIDRASSKLNSYFLSLNWKKGKNAISYNNFAGKERTYQAWNGVHESRVNNDFVAMNAFADRNYFTDKERENLINSGRTYNFYTYQNQVDNYTQSHHQLHFNHKFSYKTTLNLSGFFTHGEGYYEEFKADQSFEKYGLENPIYGTDTLQKTDLIRRKWLKNDYGGLVYTLLHQTKRNITFNFGGSINTYSGDHFGKIIWAQNTSNGNLENNYYFDNAVKSEISNFLKINYRFKKIIYFADIQHRYLNYAYEGTSEVNGGLVDSREITTFSFVNPKAGISYMLNDQNTFTVLLAISNREPVRDDFRQPVGGKKARPEQLQNIELAYKFKKTNYLFNATAYFMNYKDQLILTGKVNDVGEYTRTNVSKSYRIGLELEGSVQLSTKFDLSINASFSQNKIPLFSEYVDNYDTYLQEEIIHKNTDLAFSPNIVSAGILAYKPIKNLELTLSSKYVGDQFLDNTSNENIKLDSYIVQDFTANYELKKPFLPQMIFGIQVNNLFNHVYENNGYTYGYLSGGARINENFYFPSAGIHFIGRVTVKL